MTWSPGRKTDVSGWWIDGCYFADEMYGFADEPNFASFAAALRAGIPEAIVAFNPGVREAGGVCHVPQIRAIGRVRASTGVSAPRARLRPAVKRAVRGCLLRVSSV